MELKEYTPETAMKYAFQIAQNSTCARRRVGALITTPDFKPIACGWNHSTNGISCEAKFFSEYVKDVLPETEELIAFLQALQNDPLKAHLQETHLSKEIFSVWESFKCFTKTPEFKKLHWDFMGQEMHSEVHAVLNALRSHLSVENCILFSSRSPCEDCAKVILEVGIKKVYYTETSEKGLSGGLALLDSMIELEHLPIEVECYT